MNANYIWILTDFGEVRGQHGSGTTIRKLHFQWKNWAYNILEGHYFDFLFKASSYFDSVILGKTVFKRHKWCY